MFGIGGKENSVAATLMPNNKKAARMAPCRFFKETLLNRCIRLADRDAACVI